MIRVNDKYIKECWDKISHIQPNLTEGEFVEIITQPNFDIEGYLISQNITKEQNIKMDRWFGKNHKKVMKENYEYINSPKYQTDIDSKVELKQKLKEVYKKQRIGVLFGERYENKVKMKDYIFTLCKKYGEDSIEIVTSVVKYGLSGELKKFVLEGCCGKVGFCEFPPHHHQSTTHTKNPPYQYNKPYHPMNYRDCFMEVVEYCSGIVLFPNSDDDNEGFWISDIRDKCMEMGKPIVLVS